MNPKENENAQQALRRLYDETLVGEFGCVATLFHPEYRSSTEAGEDSADAFIVGTRKLLEEYEILERQVVLTLGDDRHVGILHRARLRRREPGSIPFDHLRTDIYRIESGRFIEHWGVPAF
jgi:predicted SnoaL-like aldol condensation-catalyzing enzyme